MVVADIDTYSKGRTAKWRTDKAGTDLPIVVATLNDADTTVHTIDLSAYLPPDTIMIWLLAIRGAGSGRLYGYPNEGTKQVTIGSGADGFSICSGPILIKKDRTHLKYRLGTASETWTVYLIGLETE